MRSRPWPMRAPLRPSRKHPGDPRRHQLQRPGWGDCQLSLDADPGPAVTLSDPTVAQPTFPAPVVNAAGVVLEFELRVTNAAGLAATDRVIVNVSDALPPVADAGAPSRPSRKAPW